MSPANSLLRIAEVVKARAAMLGRVDLAAASATARRGCVTRLAAIVVGMVPKDAFWELNLGIRVKLALDLSLVQRLDWRHAKAGLRIGAKKRRRAAAPV